MKNILITGGAGFIGSNLTRKLVNNGFKVTILDNLSKQIHKEGQNSTLDSSIKDISTFIKGDVCDKSDWKKALKNQHAVIHLAAESHVDRSIADPTDFLLTNVVGTVKLLNASLEYWINLSEQAKSEFRFVHISTDEVYGDLEGDTDLFTEETSYSPSSPYSASKASSDHLVRAWGRTYGLPCIITNCSNNYGPYHFPEKLIPHMILNALSGKTLPVYGDGKQIRDWLYVEDHAEALYRVATNGQIGETYNIGGHNEKQNIEVVHTLCDLLEELAADKKPVNVDYYKDLITFVKDRPGHDRRYAIDASKIARELGWTPKETFESGLRKTVQWYLDNEKWWSRVLSGDYKLERIGDAA